MLGFTRKIRSLTIVFHELITNSFDAAEEAGILPDIDIELKRVDKEHYILRHKDNGPGIPSQELKRVTERGFTGSAGRGNAPCSAHSTGMGLYIVSQLCQKMNIEIGLTSKEGQFTRFTFKFPAKALQNCKTAARQS